MGRQAELAACARDAIAAHAGAAAAAPGNV
jgi:hypothetical protein